MVRTLRGIGIAVATLACTILLMSCSASTAPANNSAPAVAAANTAVIAALTARAIDTPVPTQTPAPTPTVEPTATPEPPRVPKIASSTNPDPNKWYAVQNVAIAFAKQGDVPIVGYGYVVDQSASTDAPREVTTKEPQATLGDLKDGTWYVHARALAQRVLQLLDQVAHLIAGAQRPAPYLTRHQHDTRTRHPGEPRAHPAQPG